MDDSSVNAEAKRRLTAELADFLERWRQALARQAPPTDPAVIALQQHAVALQALATNTGFGEITHCLARCHHAVQTRNFADLTHSLNLLTALQHQTRPDQGQAAQSGERFRPSGSPDGLAPPPLLTVLPNQPIALYQQGASHQVAAPPHLAMAHPGAVSAPANSMETLLSARDGQAHSNLRPNAPPALSSVPAPLPLHAAPLGLAARGAREAPGLARPPLINSAPAPAPARAASQDHEQPPPSKPMLQVRNMFALRAFGREKQPSAPADSSVVPNAPQLLGLKSRKGSAPKSVVPPPQLLPNDPMGLPRLAADAAREPAQVPHRDAPPPQVQQLLDRGVKDNRRRRAETPRPRPRAGVHPRQASGSGSGWILFGAGVLGAGVLVLAGVLVFDRRDPNLPPPPQTASVPTEAPKPSDELPRSKLSETNEHLKSLVVQMHGRKLTPELRAYVDEDAALVAKALNKDCKSPNAPEVCSELTETFVDKKKLQIRKRIKDPNRPRAGWMRGLKMPAIPVDDDPRVERQFSFYTQNPVGRETFQAMLFRCGAYRDLIHSTLVKYELPTDVLAVVLAESSCFAQAKSPAGAVGLWQFIPAAARAYHLRVSEGVVDERLSPFKSTQAGVRYMADMYELFGEWDLVFAAYNMGPFGVMARLERAGGNVTYWDLVDADLLPEETENYAPAIQALALIMNNLSRLKFSMQIKPPQLTADLEAPAGTRLGMVARAAAMSAVDLRKLNLDIMGDNVPQLPGGFSVQVPQDVVWQARDTLKELLAQGDDADLCVSPTFDWGARQFTTEMAEACHRKLAGRGSGNVEGAEAPAPAEPGPAPAEPGLAPAPVRAAPPRPRPPAGPAGTPAPPAGANPAPPATGSPRLPTADDPPGAFELPEY